MRPGWTQTGMIFLQPITWNRDEIHGALFRNEMICKYMADPKAYPEPWNSVSNRSEFCFHVRISRLGPATETKSDRFEHCLVGFMWKEKMPYGNRYELVPVWVRPGRHVNTPLLSDFGCTVFHASPISFTFFNFNIHSQLTSWLDCRSEREWPFLYKRRIIRPLESCVSYVIRLV